MGHPVTLSVIKSRSGTPCPIEFYISTRVDETPIKFVTVRREINLSDVEFYMAQSPSAGLVFVSNCILY